MNELYLVIRKDDVFDRVVEVELAETTIGRDPSNDIILPDPCVSRIHAILFRRASDFLIRDHDSRNGTQLDGRSIREVVLPTPFELQIGPYQLRGYSNLEAAMKDAADCGGSTREQMKDLDSRREQLELKLTRAQRRVYELFLQALTEKEVAQRLGIKVRTVHTHCQAIYRIFGVISRSELLAVCAGFL